MLSTVCLMVIPLMILFSGFVLPAKCTVGIQKGNWVEYSTHASFESTIPNMTEPEIVGYNDLLETEFDSFEIIDVVGNLITANRTTYYKNGTQVTQNKTGNVATGAGDLGAFFVGAELNPGDSVPPLEAIFGELFYINETVYKNYLGFQREVNHLEARFKSGLMDVHLNAYWDRETGIETEVSAVITLDYLGGSLFATHSYTLIDTYSTIPEFPSWIILPLLLTITLVVRIYRKKLTNKVMF